MTRKAAQIPSENSQVAIDIVLSLPLLQIHFKIVDNIYGIQQYLVVRRVVPSLCQPYLRSQRRGDYQIFEAIATHQAPRSGDMSLLRPYYASRLLQTRLVTAQHIPPSHIRWASKTSSGEYQDRSAQPAPKSDASTSPAPTSGDSAMITQQGPGEGMVDHQPDYHAPVDHGTS